MALSNKRAVKSKRIRTFEFLHDAQTVYQGGIACIDQADGLAKKGAADPSLVPVGLYCESEVIASGGAAIVELFNDVEAYWFVNHASDAVDAADVGKLCYMADDNTVRETSNSGASPAMGMVLAVDAAKGVLVDVSKRTTPVADVADVTLTMPADAPGTADALRDDLVAYALAEIEADLNAIKAALRDAGLLAP